MFPRGQKLPLCVTCAVSASGVRVKHTPSISKRSAKSRARARDREMHQDDPAPLPEIANPVPAGWAFDEQDELPVTRASGPERPPKASRRGDSAKGDADEPNEMLSWLDSVYSTEAPVTRDR